MLNLSMIPGGASGLFSNDASHMVHGKFKVFLKRNPDRHTMTMGLDLQGFMDKTIVFDKSVFNQTEIPGKK